MHAGPGSALGTWAVHTIAVPLVQLIGSPPPAHGAQSGDGNVGLLASTSQIALG